MQPAREPTVESEKGKFFTFFVDEQEFRVSDSIITGAEVMELSGVPTSIGLVLILEDGTQRPVSAEEKLELQPGRRFKKAPRFRRG